jgi:hypothetical protein
MYIVPTPDDGRKAETFGVWRIKVIAFMEPNNKNNKSFITQTDSEIVFEYELFT